MKVALLFRGLVALALVLLIIYIARNTYWDDVTVPSPLRGEAVTNPFYAAQKLSEELGATTEVRQALGTLSSDDDVLVLSNWHWDLIEERRDHIEAWVESGGHLLVDRTLVTENGFSDWSGIRWEYPDYEDSEDEEDVEVEAPPAEQPVETDAASTDEFVDEDGEMCRELVAVDVSGAVKEGRVLNVCTPALFDYLATDHDLLWGYAVDAQLQAARVAVGEGSVTALNLTPFGNRDLTEVDHAALFVGATQLQRGSRIIFLSEHEQPSLLALMWKYGAPALVLALLALAALLWRGSVRFGPLAAATDTARRSLGEQIRGTGQFAMRLGDGKALHAAAVRALHEAAHRRIVRYGVLPHEERIEALAKATGIEQEALASAINHTGPRRSIDLAPTIALLENARRKILE